MRGLLWLQHCAAVFYISTNRQKVGHSINFKFAPISPAFPVRRSPKFISRIQTLGRIDSSQKNWKIPLQLPGRNLKVVFYIRRMTIHVYIFCVRLGLFDKLRSRFRGVIHKVRNRKMDSHKHLSESSFVR